MNLQNFVKHRDGADGALDAQNAQNSRKALAANARISIKRPVSRQSHSAQAALAIPSRGIGNVQNTSATIQHAPSRRGSGQPPKRDPYDTDAESINTTVNQSVIEGEENQQDHQQVHHPHPGHIIDLGEDSKSDSEDSDDEEGEEGGNDYEDYAFTQEEVDYLEQRGMSHLTRPEAVAFLQNSQPGRFRTIDGDSYPTTTEGDLNDWQRDQELPSEDYDGDGQLSPSLQRHVINGRRPLTPPSKHYGTVATAIDRTMNKSHALYNASAAIRNQQRANNGLAQQTGHQSNAPPAVSSQPPTYSQKAREVSAPQALVLQAHPSHQVAFRQSQMPQQNIPRPRPGPSQVTAQPRRSIEVRVPAKRPYAARTVEVPVVVQPHIGQPPVKQDQSEADGDYDPDVLHTLQYDQLKNESFDIDPRAPEQPLSEDMLNKPLIDRLEHFQKSLEPVKQADFFRSLSTTEWEDTGDWFLDQFSSIITRTKEARKKKRKLAQGFEDEIEKRHKHVSKKQHQVEDAMDRMKTQGERLMPKSPRPSKSPRPKKG